MSAKSIAGCWGEVGGVFAGPALDHVPIWELIHKAGVEEVVIGMATLGSYVDIWNCGTESATSELWYL